MDSYHDSLQRPLANWSALTYRFQGVLTKARSAHDLPKPDCRYLSCQCGIGDARRRSGSILKAARPENEIVDSAQETFWHISAETVFMLAYRSYLETQGSPEGIASRAEGIAQRVAARIEAQRGTPVQAAEVEALRRQAQSLVANHDAHFAIERRRFFYIDEFPDNDRRFDFTLDDCRPV